MAATHQSRPGPALAGMDTMVHETPSQCITSGASGLVDEVYVYPTAQTSSVAWAARPRRYAEVPGVSEGTSAFVQASPSQCSITGTLPGAKQSAPAAQTSFRDRAATAKRVPTLPRGIGPPTSVQTAPSQWRR